MSWEQPTLKVRIAFPAGGVAWLGRDCYVVAKGIVGDAGEVLDAKWGREPAKWRETGGGWGRKRLSERDRGYVDALRDSEPAGQVAALLAIIDGLTQ